MPHATISGTLNAVLCLVLRAFTIRLVKHDKFNDQHILRDVKPGVFRKVQHSLDPLSEREVQDLIQSSWDRNPDGTKRIQRSRQQGADGEQSAINSKDILKHILHARLAVVHPRCRDAAYGETGSDDRDLHETQSTMQASDLLPEEFVPTTSDAALQTLQEKRFAFTDRPSDGRRSSSRITKTLRVVEEHSRNDRGKIVVFSEFFCTLDALSVALEENNFHGVL
jgi:hypothetical protein